MVVACHRDSTTKRGRSGKVGMFENIACAINTGCFAVPNTKHAIIARAGELPQLLAAPDSGSAEIFIEARPELDIVRFHESARALYLHVVATKR